MDGYLVTCGGEVLHDWRDPERRLASGKLSLSVEDSGSFEFEVPPALVPPGGIPLMDPSREVEVSRGGEVLLRGRATSFEERLGAPARCSAEGGLAYLNDTVVRPYSTYDDEDMAANAPDSARDLFAWMVEAHNAQAGASKSYVIGRNEGPAAPGLRRRSTQRPRTAEEVRDKLVAAGGAMLVRHEGPARVVEWLFDGAGDAPQRVELGRNLLDFAVARSASDVVTAIVPAGKDGEAEVGIAGLPDGPLDAHPGVRKEGDRVVSEAAASIYGAIEEARSYDAATPEGVLAAAAADLPGASELVVGVDVSAADLSLVDPAARPIGLGQWVRVTSRPHGFDAWMRCVRIEADVCDPRSTRYVLGAEGASLTGGDARGLAGVRRAVAEVVERVPGISAEAKAAADAAAKAVVASWDEYALSESADEPPVDGWSAETPAWRDGLHVWRRAVTARGDGSTVEGAPAVMTGSAGRDGEDATLLHIESTAGTAFKNNSASTVMEVALFRGAERITSAAGIRAAFGAGAHLQWRFRMPGESEDRAVSSSDSRLSDDGFRFSITPEDVDSEATFKCDLIV